MKKVNDRKERNRIANKKYYNSHRIIIQKKRLQNREEIRKRERDHYRRNRQKLITKVKKYRDKIRLEVLSHYSNGIPKCACCGETMIEFLSIDHIKNDGSKEKSSIRKNIYLWLRKHNFPKGFQILCRNCNWGKRLKGKCPHEKS